MYLCAYKTSFHNLKYSMSSWYHHNYMILDFLLLSTLRSTFGADRTFMAFGSTTNDWNKMGNCYDNKCIMRINITLAMKPNLYIINSTLFILIFITKTLVSYHITSFSWFVVLCLWNKKNIVNWYCFWFMNVMRKYYYQFGF